MQRILIIILIIGTGLLYSCQKDDVSSDGEDNSDSALEAFPIFNDWVLVAHERTFDYKKEFQDEDDIYPVTLNFTSADEICGHYDPNTYLGNYVINDDLISFAAISTTDGYASDWYLNYLTNVSEPNLQFEISDEEELRLSNEIDGITLIFLSKEVYSDMYINVDSLYAFNGGSCQQPDTTNSQNALQGTSWVLHCVETAEVNTVKEYIPPLTETTYPITMSIAQGDSVLRGRHGVNYYGAQYTKTENGFNITDVSYTLIEDISWYPSYFGHLILQLTVSNLEDTLKLSNDYNSHLYYIEKSVFNETHYDIDSLYAE